MIASVEDTFREVERWFERLDQPFANTGIRNYVYRVRNSKAADIQGVLSQLYGGALSIPVQSANFIPANTPPGTEVAAPIQNAFSAPQPVGGQTPPGENETRIIADTVTNSLIIHATPQEYEEILLTIEQLDLLPRQVLVDAQIYEVTLDDSLSFGVTATLQNRQTLGVAETTASFAGSPPSLAATTFTLVGRTRQLVAFLNAAENRSRVRTVSAPSVLVSDNMQAQFQVGAEIPIPTSSSITPVQAAGTNLFAQTIQFRETGVLLNVSAPDQREWTGDTGDRTGNQPGRGQHDIRHRRARDRKIVNNIHDCGFRTDRPLPWAGLFVKVVSSAAAAFPYLAGYRCLGRFSATRGPSRADPN